MKRKLSPLPYEAGECSSSGSRRPGHPHSTPWSCERAKIQNLPHTSCKIVPYVLDSISTRRYYAGELFVGFLTNIRKNHRRKSERSGKKGRSTINARSRAATVQDSWSASQGNSIKALDRQMMIHAPSTQLSV